MARTRWYLGPVVLRRPTVYLVEKCFMFNQTRYVVPENPNARLMLEDI
jgi:hypothetical protein